MMFGAQPISYRDKAAFYKELTQEIQGLLGRKWYMNLANAAALLKFHLPDLNWAGFYLLQGETLYLGPFQGLPACLEIPMGKGVCGSSVALRKSMLVDDVHLFPGHIACDAASQSELVIPLVHQGRTLGVLDLDSPLKSRFTQEDQHHLSALMEILVQQTLWPAEF